MLQCSEHDVLPCLCTELLSFKETQLQQLYFQIKDFKKIKGFKSEISIYFFFPKTKISGTSEAPRSSCEPGHELVTQTRAPGGSSLARARSLFRPGESSRQHTQGPWLRAAFCCTCSIALVPPGAR